MPHQKATGRSKIYWSTRIKLCWKRYFMNGISTRSRPSRREWCARWKRSIKRRQRIKVKILYALRNHWSQIKSPQSQSLLTVRAKLRRQAIVKATYTSTPDQLQWSMQLTSKHLVHLWDRGRRRKAKIQVSKKDLAILRPWGHRNLSLTRYLDSHNSCQRAKANLGKVTI